MIFRWTAIRGSFIKTLVKKLFVLVAALVLSGCSIKSIALSTTAEILKDGMPAFEREQDLILAEHALGSNLKIVEALLEGEPGNRDLLLVLAQGYGSYAFGFVETEGEYWKYREPRKSDEAFLRAKDFYRRGRDFALSALSQDEEFSRALNKGLDSLQKALADLGKEELPYLFWATYNWGSLINLSKDSPEAIADAGRVEAMMQRLIDLEGGYYYGGPHLLYGVYLGGRPPMLGGDLKKSKSHFEKALESGQRKFLLTQVLYARYFSVQTQDDALFDSLLKEVDAAPLNRFPEQSLANQIAKRRASIYKDQRRKLF